VVAGDSIPVTVELPTGYDPEEMLVFSSEVGVSLDLPSLSTSLEIPEDYLGALTIGAIARNEADIFALAQDVSVEVMTYASLQSISVQNSPVLIRGLSLPSEILVVGHFDDGVDRYVSGASLGTTYVSQDPQIASVDAEGQVTAHGLGTTAIDVYNSGLTAQAIIVVASLPWKLTMLENDLNWNAVLDVAGYDVVRGSLEDLRTSQGDFSTSTDQCLGDNLDVMAVTDPDVPVTGNGYWYLVRVVYSTSGYVGSYDVESTGTLRDDGIAASFLGCP